MMSSRIFLRNLAVPFLLIAFYIVFPMVLDFRGYSRAVTLCFYFFMCAWAAFVFRGKIRNGFLILSSFIFGLCVLEIGAAALDRNPIHLYTKGLYQSRPPFGTGPGAGVFSSKKIDAVTGSPIYDVKYTIDPTLLRHTISRDVGPTVAFFGDSLTFGEGVDDLDTMPQIFSDLNEHQFRVLNFGSSGYGPQQYLRALDTGFYDPLLSPDLRLIVYMTAPWHAERVACKPYYTLPTPRYILTDGKVSFHGRCAEGLRLKFLEWAESTAIYRTFMEKVFTRVNHADIELYIATVLKAVMLGKEKYHVPTLIVFLPADAKYLQPTGFTNDEIVGRLRTGGAIVVDGGLSDWLDQASLTIKGDGHPTPLAHRARAELINRYLRQNMPQALTQKSLRNGSTLN